MTSSLIQNILSLTLLILLFILIPFFLFHQQFDNWAGLFFDNSAKGTVWIGFLIILLLATDMFLPIPSTILSTASGYIFGIFIGTLLSFIGMTIGVLLGYWLGNSSRNTLPWLDKATTAWLNQFFNTNGIWAIALARPVPVIAETSVLFAGISKMDPLKFISIASLSNLGISIVYASLGAFSVSTNSFLLAFCGSITIPAFWMFFKLIRK